MQSHQVSEENNTAGTGDGSKYSKFWNWIFHPDTQQNISLAATVISYIMPATTLVPVSKVINELQQSKIREVSSSWEKLRLEYRDEMRRRWCILSSRQFMDSKIEQLRFVLEMSAYLGGFALACLVELPIPPNIPTFLMIPFAVLSTLTICIFTLCSVVCALVLVSVCDPNSIVDSTTDNTNVYIDRKEELGRSIPDSIKDTKHSHCQIDQSPPQVPITSSLTAGQLPNQTPIQLLIHDLSMFHNRWNNHRKNDWTLVMYLLLYGADCMLFLTSIIVFITSYHHRAGLVAGFLSFFVLFVSCVLIGRMWRQYSHILV